MNEQSTIATYWRRWVNFWFAAADPSTMAFIRIVTGCASLASWTLTGLCLAWHAQLLNQDFTLAPNPVPKHRKSHLQDRQSRWSARESLVHGAV